ncbi:olfactory receptor 5B3-like [Erethizon dorsatum]
MEHTTEVRAFIPRGLARAPELQVPLFATVVLVYLVTLTGNLGVTVVILLDPRLHTPKYFFLGNLSLVHFCYSSTVTPKVAAGLLTEDNLTSYNACAAQMFFVLFATVESYFLASVAYDRFVAVCKPPHCPAIMTRSVCARLAVGSHVPGLLTAAIDVGDTFCLPLCVTNVARHFFCGAPAAMTLACSDRHINELMLFFISSFNIFLALIILICYLFVLTTVMKMHSGEGYQKALFTCASHLTAISIFYGTIMVMYLQPSSSHSMDTDKVASVFYTMVIPMLNPMVYSLRNKEVKSAFQKVAEKAKYSLGLVI